MITGGVCGLSLNSIGFSVDFVCLFAAYSIGFVRLARIGWNYYIIILQDMSCEYINRKRLLVGCNDQNTLSMVNHLRSTILFPSTGNACLQTGSPKEFISISGRHYQLRKINRIYWIERLFGKKNNRSAFVNPTVFVLGKVVILIEIAMSLFGVYKRIEISVILHRKSWVNFWWDDWDRTTHHSLDICYIAQNSLVSNSSRRAWLDWHPTKC